MFLYLYKYLDCFLWTNMLGKFLEIVAEFFLSMLDKIVACGDTWLRKDSHCCFVFKQYLLFDTGNFTVAVHASFLPFRKDRSIISRAPNPPPNKIIYRLPRMSEVSQ